MTLEDSESLHRYEVGAQRLHQDLTQRQRDQRNQLLETGLAIRPLTALVIGSGTAGFGREADGWPDEPVEAWRMSSYELFWHQLVTVSGRAVLTKEDTTWADWVGAFVDLAAIRTSRSEFLRFWAYEVDLEMMPRNWIRWAVNILQHTEKVTRGNPSDEQHSAYLLDCDIFLTADSRYASVLQSVREDAPFEMAETKLVSGDREIPVLDRVRAVLELS